MEEEKVIESIRNGNIQIFEMVFKSFYNPLVNYAHSLLRDKEEAEDIVQQAFLQFWQKREKIFITISLKAYLYRMVYHAALNNKKHQELVIRYAQSGGNEPNWYPPETDFELAKHIELAVTQRLTTPKKEANFFYS